MKTATIDKLVWILVYLGLVVVGVGLMALRVDDVLGWSGLTLGSLLLAGGVATIVIRSRMKEVL